jgi:putative flippase GtrA
MSAIRGLYGRWQHIVHELAKFGVIGAIAYGIDVTIFNLLSHNGAGPLTAKTISTIVAATFAYFGNRHWSFTHRARTGIRREYAIFIVVSAGGLAIALACLGFGYYVLDQTGPLARNFWGNIVGTGLGTIFRFWAYKKFVFLHPDDPKAMKDPLKIAAAEKKQQAVASAAATSAPTNGGSAPVSAKPGPTPSPASATPSNF